MTKKGKKKKQQQESKQQQDTAPSTSDAGASKQTSQQPHKQQQTSSSPQVQSPSVEQVPQQQASTSSTDTSKQQTKHQWAQQSSQQQQKQQRIPQTSSHQAQDPHTQSIRQQASPQSGQGLQQPQQQTAPQSRWGPPLPPQQQPQQQMAPQSAWRVPLQHARQQAPPQSGRGSQLQQQLPQQAPPQSGRGSQLQQQPQQQAPPQSGRGSQLQQQSQQQAPPQSGRGSQLQQQSQQQTAPQSAWRIPLQQAQQQAPLQSGRGHRLQQQPQQQAPPQSGRGSQLQQQPQQQTAPQSAWRIPRLQQTQQQAPPQSAWGTPAQQPQQQATTSSVQEPRPSTSAQPYPEAGDYRQKQIESDITGNKGETLTKYISHFSLGSPTAGAVSKKPKYELQQCQLDIPKRQNITKAGTKGTPIRVAVNMFEIMLKPNFVTKAVHYDIDITPIAPKFLLRNVFEKCRSLHFSDRFPAFDGKKNAYSANNLPFNDHMMAKIEIYDKGREENREFTITFNKVAEIDLSWIKNLRPGLDEASRDQTGIQVLDIILRHAPSTRLLPVGRSFFSEHNVNPPPLGNGLELYYGAFQSAVLGWRPYLNIDVCHKGFPIAQTVIDLMIEYSCRYPEDRLNAGAVERNRERINKFLAGLKVTYAIPNIPSSKRTYRIKGLANYSADRHSFEVEGKMYTIEQYFAKFKKCKLNYPSIPCIWAISQKNPEIYLPAEFCTIVAGQAINKKMDEIQTAKMVRLAATATEKRRQKIRDAFNMLNVNNSPVMRNEFHLSINDKMKEVDARILSAPKLQYNNQISAVSKGVWYPKSFNRAVQLADNTWTILNLTGSVIDNQLYSFIEVLMQQANSLGMKIGKPKTPFASLRASQRDIRPIINYFQDNKKLKLIIVVIPDRMSVTYSKVKQIAELQVGILTQCIKNINIMKKQATTVSNILLKINTKLNGVNHTFTNTGLPSCMRGANCMFIGADVSHPSPDARNIPSIAAVAASHDLSGVQYNIEVRLQEPKTEMIVDFEQIIIKQLAIYYYQTKTLPTRIIFYRDGVSEGQLAQVMYYEVEAIKRACKEFKRNNPTFKQPEITCLVVQKRHHVRIFPTRESDSDDRNHNVKAGTIVDQEITHPNHIDFYLVSHASIQGTARPTKYRCICNDSQFSEDDIEELTYYLCHIYARCTRSVSYPAPTYYAHLAAYRGRAWIHEVDIRLDRLQEEQRRKLDVKMFEDPMYFI